MRSFGEMVTRLSNAVLTQEVGIPGGTVENGVSVPSYNAELAGRAWFEKVDEMLLASSQAAVIELCVTLPILSAETTLKGGDAKLRGQVETSLFGTKGMSTTWRETLYNACGSALYGQAPFEIVWKETDEGLLVRRLADRDPASIEEYLPAPDGGLEAVLQKGLDPETGDEIEILIPIEKMLLFPYRLRRRQYHGRSILRPAYRNYESINMLCGFADIGLDHSMVGVPIGKAPKDAKLKDLEGFRSLLSAIRRHEASGLVMPYGWDLVNGVKLGGDDQIGFLDYIQWHEGCFLRAGLSSFMQLGSTRTGTTELGGDLMDFSIMAWSALADMIAGVFNRHLIRRHCDYNAGRELDEKAYPELEFQPIRDVFGSHQNQEQAGRFIGAVADGKELLPEDPEERQQAMREGLRLPDGDSRREGAPMPGNRNGNDRHSFAEADVQTAVSRVKADGAAARDEWQAEMTPRLEALLSNLLRQVDLAQTSPPGPLSAGGEGESIDARLAEIAPNRALVDDLATGIARFVAGVRVQAALRYAEETGAQQAAPLQDPAPAAAEVAKGRNVAAHLAESTRFAVVGAALRGEPLGQLASAFAKAVDVRLRNDLRAEAKTAVDGVNGAPRAEP